MDSLAIGPHADLTGMDFSGVDLTGVDLSYTNLSGATFIDAILTGTVLDPRAPVPAIEDRVLFKAGFALRGDLVYGWRTRHTLFQKPRLEYLPGRCYRAPVFSVCQKTGCHPGIYIASKEWLLDMGCYQLSTFIRCFCRRDEMVHAADKFRCKRLWVLTEDLQ
jgi:hypothetical protein